MRASSRIAELSRLGPREALSTMYQHLFSTRRFLGLRCDLSVAPRIPQAKLSVSMTARGSDFAGFSDELRSVAGRASLDAFVRQRMVERGVQTLYVAETEAGDDIYAQWLVTPATLETLDRFSPGRYPRLAVDEALVEGAYTFSDFRGLGVMAAGMAQLMATAHASGARAVITYVGEDNIPSLRGCARVGFELDHLRTNRRRFGMHSSVMSGLDDAARRAWAQAIGR
jgi:RimJ/RimL family protein N-acetyltransferase